MSLRQKILHFYSCVFVGIYIYKHDYIRQKRKFNPKQSYKQCCLYGMLLNVA